MNPGVIFFPSASVSNIYGGLGSRRTGSGSVYTGRLKITLRERSIMKKIKRPLQGAGILILTAVPLLFGFSGVGENPKRLLLPRVSAKIMGVLTAEDPSGGTILYIKLRETGTDNTSSESDREILLENKTAIRCIEDAHFLLMDEFISGDLSAKDIHIDLFGAETESRNIADRTFTVITSVDKINPDSIHSEDMLDPAELSPPCPEPDFHHRYIEVPFSYRHPERGTFHLYYEIDSDFDPGKPTVIIPTDGQRSSSLIGWADRYKKIFALSFNVVTHEYRGMPCARIREIGEKQIDWKTAYEYLNTDNAVEDIERIRKNLLGDQKAYLLGGSGTAMMGLKYLAKYHRHVERAYLMSFFKDAETSSRSGLTFFDSFLKQNHLEKTFADIIERKDISPEQFLFLVQRLLYFDQDKTRELIQRTAGGDMSPAAVWTQKLGPVDYFIRSAQKYRPWAVVFMYETNIEPRFPGKPDINYPFFTMAQPLNKLAAQRLIPTERFDIRGLENISTEILLVGGTLDQVAPIADIEEIHELLPRSRLAVFEAYHCLQVIPEAKQCRNELINVFLQNGLGSGALSRFLKKSGEKSRFLEMK